MIFLYQLGFGLGLGPIAWFLVPEYFNDDSRSIATMICTIANWIFSFIIILAFPQMESSIGIFGALLLFFVVCIGSFIFGIFMISEPQKVIHTDQKSDSNQNTTEGSNNDEINVTEI